VQIDRVCALLSSLTTQQPVLPPTELYCEGWLLRIILDWYSTHHMNGDALDFAEGARWFSEARLPSAFRPRTRGDPLGEARAHADGVIGHFTIGGTTKAGLTLQPDANCFVVLEAKMSSGLSPGVINVSGFDQAARSIACMAEALRLANRSAASMSRLAFYVLAPRAHVSKGKFAQLLDPARILATVRARAQAYEGEKDQWYADWFQPTLGCIQIGALAWEDVIASIDRHDAQSGREISTFYERCLKYNAKSA
jgi:hypothetical protein